VGLASKRSRRAFLAAAISSGSTRIHVRPRVVEGELDCIRVTPNVFTTLDEVDLFAEAIEEISRKGLA